MAGYAVPKDVYKKQCEDLLADKQKEIAALERKLQKLDKASDEYKKCQQDLIKANQKAKDYAQSIYTMDIQMNLQTHPRYRGLPFGVTISGR